MDWTAASRWVAGLAAVLIFARWAMEFGLNRLNQRHVQAHAGSVPEAFKDFVEPATYQKAVQYTLAKSRFGQFEDIFSAVLLLIVVFSGVLPWAFAAFTRTLGSSAWAMAALLFVVGLALTLPALPLDWYAQFR